MCRLMKIPTSAQCRYRGVAHGLGEVAPWQKEGGSGVVVLKERTMMYRKGIRHGTEGVWKKVKGWSQVVVVDSPDSLLLPCIWNRANGFCTTWAEMREPVGWKNLCGLSCQATWVRNGERIGDVSSSQSCVHDLQPSRQRRDRVIGGQTSPSFTGASLKVQLSLLLMWLCGQEDLL